MTPDQRELARHALGLPDVEEERMTHPYDGHASFTPGTCDWTDSLVMRPGYEE